jgi:hypothetical protein
MQNAEHEPFSKIHLGGFAGFPGGPSGRPPGAFGCFGLSGFDGIGQVSFTPLPLPRSRAGYR